jgi:hypothetical protein
LVFWGEPAIDVYVSPLGAWRDAPVDHLALKQRVAQTCDLKRPASAP